MCDEQVLNLEEILHSLLMECMVSVLCLYAHPLPPEKGLNFIFHLLKSMKKVTD
jgi:hypothetical protein